MSEPSQWVKVYLRDKSSPSVFRLARVLGVQLNEAFGLWAKLQLVALAYGPTDGSVAIDAEYLAHELDHHGDADELMKALREAEILDKEFRIVGWNERQNGVVERERDRRNGRKGGLKSAEKRQQSQGVENLQVENRPTEAELENPPSTPLPTPPQPREGNGREGNGRERINGNGGLARISQARQQRELTSAFEFFSELLCRDSPDFEPGPPPSQWSPDELERGSEGYQLIGSAGLPRWLQRIQEHDTFIHILEVLGTGDGCVSEKVRFKAAIDPRTIRGHSTETEREEWRCREVA